MSIFKKAQPYIVVFAAALFFLFEFINMNSFNALNLQLRQAFHAQALQISNLSAMYFYANVIFLIPAGLLLDRISTRLLLTIAMSVCVVATFVFASTNQLWVAQLCRFLTGMGSTFCLLSCSLLTSRWIQPRYAALVMGLAVTMAMLGGMLAQQMTNLTDYLGSWRLAISAVGGLGVVFLALVVLLVKDAPAEFSLSQTHQKYPEGFWRNFGLALGNIQNWLAGIYTNFLSIPVIVLGALWGKEYLHRVKGLSNAHAAVVASMIFLGMIVGSPLSGWISDRLKRRKMPMILGAILTLITVLVIIYVQPLSYTQLVSLFFLLGLFSGAQVISYALVIESNPLHITASSTALAATLIMASGAIFQPLFGYLLEHFGTHSLVNGTAIYHADAYHAAMMILPITFVASIIIALLLKETQASSH